MNQTSSRWRWTAKRAAFSLLRAVQPVYLFDAVDARSSLPIRVQHVGNAFRGRPFVERIYGDYPAPIQVGRTVVGPWSGRFSMPDADFDFQLVEINRLYSAHWRKAGFLVIPEWVLFGRAVEADESRRYAAATQTLRREIRAVRDARLTTTISRADVDFDFYYTHMYLPHVTKRFGEGTIIKPRQKLQRDFRRGALLLVIRDGQPIAGGVVRVDGGRVSMTSMAVRDGSDVHLRLHASAALDLGLHEWAAAQGMRGIDVGHTRPFLEDGIFRNKRRWLMTVSPDHDGVMGMALCWRGAEEKLQGILARFPFVYESARGLGVLVVHRSDRPIDTDEAEKIWRRSWTDGLTEVTVVCPAGLRGEALAQVRDAHGPSLRICADLAEARRLCAEGPGSACESSSVHWPRGP